LTNESNEIRINNTFGHIYCFNKGGDDAEDIKEMTDSDLDSRNLNVVVRTGDITKHGPYHGKNSDNSFMI
jgi:hypothetical protein